MEINERLNKIIMKYNLDTGYPQYRKRLRAEQFLRNWMQGLADREETVLCITLKQDDIDYFSFLSRQMGSCITYICVPNPQKIEEKILEMDLKKYHHVYAISIQHGYIVYCCSKMGVVCKSIYMEMEQEGIFFDQECYKVCNPGYEMFTGPFSGGKYCEGTQIEFFIQKQNMQQAGTKAEKMFFLRKMFFLLIYMKDFLNAEKYVREICRLDQEDGKNCIAAWGEICELLTMVRQRVSGRTQQDIIMVWMDAVGRDECDEMPYLQAFRENGVDFENAFTVMPYTNATLMSIFHGTRVLEERFYQYHSISHDSRMIAILEEKGYQVQIASGYMRVFAPEFETGTYHESGASCTELFWDILDALTQEKKPLFVLGHALAEGHSPHFYSDMVDADFMGNKERQRSARKALDRQIEYFMDFIGDNAIRILMSDHGLKPNVLTRSHTNLIVQKKGLTPGKISGIFSYTNFSGLIVQLLKNDLIQEELLTADHAKLEDPDLYNKKRIAEIIANKEALSLFPDFGYQGYVTKDWIYLKYNIGKEVLAHRDNPMNKIVYFSIEDEIDGSDPGMLAYFRGLPYENTRLDELDEKYKYSKYLIQVLENYRKYAYRKEETINHLFSGFAKASVALRMGGEHTLALYRMLSPGNREKIYCIIDRDEHCLASALGIPVYTLEHMDYSKVKYVIPSSFEYRGALIKEMESICHVIKVIDLYQYLEEQGIHMDRAIYKCESIPDECYDVGFPFEEIE